jgi:undecaprenyl-diphosphatase
MIPVGIVGFMLRDKMDALLASNYIMAIVGAMLLLTAVLLAFAYYARPRQRERISYRDAFIIGLSQAVAVMPGLSRSGTTIATGLLLGNKKSSVATFSFLMVLAPIMGQAFLDVVDGGFAISGVSTVALVAGFVTAFVVGCLACRFMIEVVKRAKLVWFAIYCAMAGLLSLGLYIFN